MFESDMSMQHTTFSREDESLIQPAILPGDGAEQPPAWEMIENGRYQPKRIKGSCLGRELG